MSSRKQCGREYVNGMKDNTMNGLRDMMQLDVFASRYFMLSTFVEAYKSNPDAILSDLKDYFGLELMEVKKDES